MNDEQITCLELFGGIGGFSRAIKLWFPGIRVTDYCDIDESAIRVFQHHYPEVTIHCDITEFHGQPGQWRLIVGGFPCSGTSQAGYKNGLKHKASSLWWEQLRVIESAQPDFVIVEQPEGVRHADRGLLEIVHSLNEIGYVGEWETITAGFLGAPHKRSRLFVVAYPNYIRDQLKERPVQCWQEQIRDCVEGQRNQSSGSSIVRVSDNRRQRERQPGGMGVDDGVPGWLCNVSFDEGWNGTPPLRAGIPGKRIAGRRDVISCCGRAVAPKQAAIPLRRVCYLDSLLRD